MRIAVIGAQGTGKSTLCNQLIKEKFFTNYKYKPSGTANLFKRGTDLSDKDVNFKRHTLHIHMTQSNVNFLTDRCVWDTMFFGQKDFAIKDPVYCEYLETSTIATLEMFDYIVLLEPEFEIKDNGIRSLSKKDQEEYTQSFKDFYIENNLDSTVKLISPKGSVTNRVNYIINRIQ